MLLVINFLCIFFENLGIVLISFSNNNDMKGSNMQFPDIQTNFWDAITAVPLVVIITQIFKVFPIKKKYFPSIASTIGFIISIFISHRGDLPAGLFMGAFYGAAAVGLYSSLKTVWLAYRNKHK
jgi:hypothetical protein